MFQVMSYYLENGMKVYLHRLPQIKILTVGIIVHHGSVNESVENNGISHFIEHLVMNKNTNNKIMLNNFNELLKYGATYNAETSKDSTFYYFTGLSEGIDVYLDMLKEALYYNRDYSEALFENEKKVVLQEFQSHIASFNQIQDRTMQALYGDMGLGRLVLGNRENILEFSKDDVIKKISEVYTPENTSIMVIGDFDYNKISEKVNSCFNYVNDISTKKVIEKISGSPGVYHNPSYKGANSVLSMGFRYYEKEMTDEYFTVMKYILNAMCNFTISNRIIYYLREKLGLVYTTSGFVQNNLDFCSLGLYSIFNSEKVEQVAEIMLNEIKNLKENGFKEDEFKLLKNNLIMNRLKEKVNMDDQVYCFTKSIKNKKIYSPENDLRIIKNMKIEDANRIASQILDMNNLGIACIGNCNIDKVLKFV